MDYSSIFAISAAGMEAQRTRLDVAAMNIANINTTRSFDGGPYIPLQVVTHSKKSFLSGLTQLGHINPVNTLPAAKVTPQLNNVAKLKFEPSHPDANPDGFVAYPGIDTTTEMVNMMTAVRAYEANTVALNAAKSMALKAIDMGRGI